MSALDDENALLEAELARMQAEITRLNQALTLEARSREAMAHYAHELTLELAQSRAVLALVKGNLEALRSRKGLA